MLDAIKPGEILKEEFLKPLGITFHQLCVEADLDEVTVDLMLKGRVKISPEIDQGLTKYFGLSNGYWIRCQELHDRLAAKDQT